MNEVRIAKFETFIENINKIIEKPDTSRFSQVSLLEPGIIEKNLFELIFDYDECNEYAKIIQDKAALKFTQTTILSNYEIPRTKKDVAKLVVRYCKELGNAREGYKFIFWSLMILTVDKNNAQEYLSLICDFAKMLQITNEELEDIIYVIKCVYNKADEKYTFKSEFVFSIFRGIVIEFID